MIKGPGPVEVLRAGETRWLSTILTGEMQPLKDRADLSFPPNRILPISFLSISLV